MGSLPEVLKRIIFYLDLQGLGRVSCVSKGCRDYIENDFVWEHFKQRLLTAHPPWSILFERRCTVGSERERLKRARVLSNITYGTRHTIAKYFAPFLSCNNIEDTVLMLYNPLDIDTRKKRIRWTIFPTILAYASFNPKRPYDFILIGIVISHVAFLKRQGVVVGNTHDMNEFYFGVDRIYLYFGHHRDYLITNDNCIPQRYINDSDASPNAYNGKYSEFKAYIKSFFFF